MKRRPHQPLRLNCDAEDCHSAVCGAEDRTGTSCCLHACPGDALLLYLTVLYDFTRRKNSSAFLSVIHIMEGIISCNKNKNLLPWTIILFIIYYYIKSCKKEASFDAPLVRMLPCGFGRVQNNLCAALTVNEKLV